MFFKKLVDFLTLGSEHPVKRLLAYYTVLAALIILLAILFPIVDQLLGGQGPVGRVETPELLPDGMASAPIQPVEPEIPHRLELAFGTLTMLFGTLLLMLPVAWVYMSTRPGKELNQQVAQTLIFLPIVVAGIVMIVQNSLALAFSLAGVVAAVRFRTTLRDSRDVVFVFLAIAVGFAAGVQALIIGAIVSVVFNFVLILTWRYEFGRSVLEPTASAQWTEPLQELAQKSGNGKIPDRDLAMALDQSQATALAERFDRVRKILGPSGKKPRYNSILSISTDKLGEVQGLVAGVLDEQGGRWRLDDVVTNAAKPSELYYLVQLRKRTKPDDLITAIRAEAGELIVNAQVEVGEDPQGSEDGKEKTKETKA